MCVCVGIHTSASHTAGYSWQYTMRAAASCTDWVHRSLGESFGGSRLLRWWWASIVGTSGLELALNGAEKVPLPNSCNHCC